MNKKLFLSALFAGAIVMNSGFGTNDGMHFDTCDSCINYIMGENGNAQPAQITRRLGDIAKNPGSLDGLPRGDKINLIYLIDTIDSKERSPRGGYIDRIIDHLQADIMPNNEAQNNADDEIFNQAQDEEDMEINELQFDALQDNRRRAHNEIHEDVNNNEDGSYCAKRIKKIASKSKEKLHQAGEAIKPAIDYVKNNPAKSAGYAAGVTCISEDDEFLASIKDFYDNTPRAQFFSYIHQREIDRPVVPSDIDALKEFCAPSSNHNHLSVTNLKYIGDTELSRLSSNASTTIAQYLRDKYQEEIQSRCDKCSTDDGLSREVSRITDMIYNIDSRRFFCHLGFYYHKSGYKISIKRTDYLVGPQTQSYKF